MTDEDGKVVTLQELRARREQKKYERAGLDTMLETQMARFEFGDKPSDVVQKVIDMYLRVQAGSNVGDDSDEYVVTPIKQILDNLWNVKEMFQYAEHFAEVGMAAPTREDCGLLQVSAERPLEQQAFRPPARLVPKLHVVENCGNCPMEYEGHCAHPNVDYAEHAERLRDCDDYYDKPHPRCPLKTNPVFLRTKQ